MPHLGDCRAFRERMENLIDTYGASAEQLVFISDGAIWRKDAYSGAVSILDYFNEAEHLYEFVNAYFKNKEQREVLGVNSRKVCY